jgi:hypothetical protein
MMTMFVVIRCGFTMKTVGVNFFYCGVYCIIIKKNGMYYITRPCDMTVRGDIIVILCAEYNCVLEYSVTSA